MVDKFGEDEANDAASAVADAKGPDCDSDAANFGLLVAEDRGYSFLHFSWKYTTDLLCHDSHLLSLFSILFIINVFNPFSFTETTDSILLYSILSQIQHNKSGSIFSVLQKLKKL